MAQKRFWEGSLSDECLTFGMLAAKSGNNRPALRALHRLRGSWKLARREWAESLISFQESVRMARERRLIDAESEAGLALAKICLGQLDGDDALNEVERLAQQRQVAHRYLAMLFLAIHDTDRAKVHALEAYSWAWADGEPYVHRYELAQATLLLQGMNVQIPELPPYDPEKDDPFPWEAEVCAVIEKLNAVHGPKQGP